MSSVRASSSDRRVRRGAPRRRGAAASSPLLEVRDTGTPKGRGIFARRAIASGEIVEESPVILFDDPWSALPHAVQKVLFSWHALGGDGGAHALALGCGSLFNHASPANLRYTADAQARVVRFIAVRDIPAGEELCINYNARGGGAEWADDNWFDRMGVEPYTPEIARTQGETS
jgi:hypothetical protein